MVSTGIQKLVSTYELSETSWGAYSRPTQTQSTKDLPKFSWGGGFTARPTFLKYLSGGTRKNFEHKYIPLELATASQIVSHILLMYAETNERKREIYLQTKKWFVLRLNLMSEDKKCYFKHIDVLLIANLRGCSTCYENDRNEPERRGMHPL